MSEDAKKPRNIKDLKARLGRGATGGEPGASVPPPAIGAAGTGVGDVAPPPFAQQPARSIDPFASGAVAAQGPREVRLVIDDKPVEDAEVGRNRSRTVLIVASVSAVVALLIGYLAGGTMGQRRLQNAVVRDAKEIYGSVQASRSAIEQGNRLVQQLVSKARSAPGKAPAADYDAIQQLIAIKAPFKANVFARKYYKAFGDPTVEALFEYFNTAKLAWARIGSLGASTLAPARRADIDRAATAANDLATRAVGCVPFVNDGNYGCGLVYVDVPTEQTDPPPTKFVVRARSGGAAAGEKERYTGQSLENDPSQYVVMVDTVNSVGVLGTQASAFAEYQRDVLELKGLFDKLTQLEGQLENQIGEVTKVGEVFAF